MVTEVKRSFVRPTVQTCFHIDFNWWVKNNRDWKVYLRNYLCQDHQKVFKSNEDDTKVDFIDPETAEVQQVDGIQHYLITHCAKQADYITSHTTLVDAVFRTFLANGNRPLTSIELGEQLNRSPDTIMRTLSSPLVKQGILPCVE